MSLSRTDVANLALIKVGEARIRDLDEDSSKSARIASTLFEPCVREVLRRHAWNFAKDRASLGRLATDPSFGWAYQYQLPADFIRMLRFNGYELEQAQDYYEIEGLRILTDAEEAKIAYVKYVADTTQWDAMFVECVSLLMGARLATDMRQDANLGLRLSQEFERYIGEAMRIDSSERKSTLYDTTSESRWVAARRYSTNG